MTTVHAPGTPAPPEEAMLAVVGIGASAGGLKALQQFVEAVPADSGLAFVVIMHLDPERESRMSELLQDRSAIPVTQVSGPVTLEADHIYMIPPGQDLIMRGYGLELRTRGERAEHAPVDLFFRTLAEACGADAVGVILSGTGEDGTAGIRYIREAGGITVAQSPNEAAYEGMPTSAISTGLVDLVVPAARIPTGVGIAAERLTRIFERFWQVDSASTRAAGGMGIGLAAAREYAQLLRGDVQVISTPGTGTTFSLSLPADVDLARPISEVVSL